ncbi:hypothetical protein AX660_18650 [Paraglaciecola hydrolytica]|uniref:Uncharacterized protein n=1 Tax=Paraglaciecola hydrolytica TaxID=1799789 RepID=A0A135ZZI3_9ALTE|nr:hypothetical protein AX660_18650 [Paraglaciecola hydrolytica]
MTRKLATKNKLRLSSIFKNRSHGNNTQQIQLTCQSSDTHESTRISKKSGQEIALKRRIKFSKYNKRQRKKYLKNNSQYFSTLGSIVGPNTNSLRVVDL